MMPKRGRFAPSPTGRLHAGNLFAYLMAWLDAKSTGGLIVLRIEDLDAQRSKPAFADQLMRDLEQVGLTWERGPIYQSQRTEAYQEAFSRLSRAGHLYPCFCTRAEANAQAAPHRGEGSSYTGACRTLSIRERRVRREALAACGRASSFRLAMEDGCMRFDDLFQGEQVIDMHAGADDFIVRRADGGFAYQLAVVVDDADEGIDSVVRGCDLLPSTAKQIHLHHRLGTPTPTYGHIPLFVADDGRRLAKRDHDAAFDEMMRTYRTPAALMGHLAFRAGILDEDVPAMPDELVKVYDPATLRKRYRNQHAITFAML